MSIQEDQSITQSSLPLWPLSRIPESSAISGPIIVGFFGIRWAASLLTLPKACPPFQWGWVSSFSTRKSRFSMLFLSFLGSHDSLTTRSSHCRLWMASFRPIKYRWLLIERERAKLYRGLPLLLVLDFYIASFRYCTRIREIDII